MRKIILLLISVAIASLAPVLLISCGGGSSSGGNSSTGDVALYVTDSPDEDYKQVEITINSVQLVHTGLNTACEVMTTPVTLDITDIASVLHLLDVTSCTPANYNRIHVEFHKQTTLIDTGDVTDTCTFTSYKDEHDNPNTLNCAGEACYIDINGAVNVFANQNTKLVLDFELKKFEVENFNSLSGPCTVTMKVSPLSASDHDDYDEELSGYISNLNPDLDTFTLSAEGGTFTVSYALVSQEGIEALLTLAEDDHLEVEVKNASIDLNGFNINASHVQVEIEGTVSDLDDTVNHTFTLTYQTSKTIPVDYTSAEEVEGALANGATVEVELEGYDGANYLAHEVEVEQAGDLD